MAAAIAAVKCIGVQALIAAPMESRTASSDIPGAALT